jgi:hypothetical protein
MKICISEQSLKDFNTFFKAKALELQNKNKYKKVEQLYLALYNEALTLSGDIENVENSEVVLQHLAFAPIVLNDTIPEHQDQIAKDALESMAALSDLKKLDKLMVKKIKQFINVQSSDIESITEEELIEDDITNYDYLEVDGAVHIKLFDDILTMTTQGSETIVDTNNKVDPTKTVPFAATRTVLNGMLNNNEEYKLMGMSYNKLVKNTQGRPLDQSTTAIPNSINAGMTTVFVITDSAGNILEFDSKGNVTKDGVIPVYSTISPTTIGTEFWTYAYGTKNMQNPIHIKFATMEKNMGLENLIEKMLGPIDTETGKHVKGIGWIDESKSFIASIRNSEFTILKIDKSNSTFGYNKVGNTKTQLSDIQGISNFTFGKVRVGSEDMLALTGSTLHNQSAIIIPNDIDTNPELVETLVSIITDSTLINEDGTKLTSKQKRDILANYIAVNKFSRLKILDNGSVRIHKDRVDNKTDFEQEVRAFFTEFQLSKKVDSNPQNRPITTDLKSKDNTSAMLFQDSSGQLYEIYKPKFSYNKQSFSSLTIEGKQVVSTLADKKQHIINNSATKSSVNAEGILKVYHPKLAYTIDSEDMELEYELEKTQEQKEANNIITEEDNTAGFSWFEGSPLKGPTPLRNALLNSEDRPVDRHAVAKFVGNAIVLFRGSDFTDIYHEAWHSYTQGILTIAEKKTLYTAVANELGVKLGDKITNGQAREIEEFLAEEFRAYAIGKSKIKKTSVIGKFFQAILDSLKNLIGIRSKSDLIHNSAITDIVKEHFKNLYTHNIDVTKYNSSNFMFTTLNKNLKFPDDKSSTLSQLSAEETSLMLGTLDKLVSKDLDYNTTDKLSKGYESLDNIIGAYKYALSELNTILQTQAKEVVELNKQLKKTTKNTSQHDELKNMIRVHSGYVKMLEASIENFGDLANMDNNIFNGSSPTNLIGFHLMHGKVYNYNSLKNVVNEDNFYENEDESNGKIFEKGGTESSLFDMANEHIVYMLSTINKYKSEKKVITAADIKASQSGPANKRIPQSSLGKTIYPITLDRNVLGVPLLERPVVVMAKLGKLLNSSNNGDEMYAKMKAAQITDPIIGQVLQKLGDYQSDSISQQLLWSNFIQTFSKSNNKLQQFIIERVFNSKTETYLIESKYGTTLGGTNAVSRAWEAVFPTMTSEYLVNESTGIMIDAKKVVEDFLINKGKGKWELHNKEGYVDFYRAIGIDITDTKNIEKELANNNDILNAIATRLNDKIAVDEFNKLENNNPENISSLKALIGKHSVMNSDNTDVSQAPGLNSYYLRLQRIEFDLSDKYNSFMGTNAKGESQSELSLNNTASIITNDINGIVQGTTIDKIISENNHLKFLDSKNDPFMRSSRFFKALFTETGERTNRKLTFENFSGATLLQEDDSLGLTNMDLDRSSKVMVDIYLSFLGKSEVVRMADKTTSMHMGMDMEQTFNAELILALKNNPTTDPTMYNELKEYLAAEIVRINILNNIEGPFDQDYKERGVDFFIFDDILTPELKESLRKIDSTDFDAVMKELAKKDTKKIIASINDYFAKKTETISAAHRKDLFITDNIINTIQDQLNIHKPEEEHTIIDTEQAKDIMIGMFQRNKFLHNLDVTTFYLGDPALYDVKGGNFTKRNAGVISTGDIFRNDSSFLNFINSRDENGFIKARGWSNTVTGSKNAYEDYDGRLNTGIINDHIATSVYTDTEVFKAFGKEGEDVLYQNSVDDISEYDGMTEPDGQGVISFDSYRLLNLAQGTWSTEQDEQYNLIINRSIKLEDGTIVPGNYDQTKYTKFFPSLKLQYFGPLDTNFPLRLQAFHKFNLVPLIPGMIAGTKLENLQNTMMEQGMDYVTFKSGSKLSTISNNESGSDQFYGADREITTDPNFKFEKNVIFAKYLKNQLKIHDHYVGKSTLATQMRKIVVSGIFTDNNVPNDFNGTKTQWDNLSPKQKIEKSAKWDWFTRYLKGLKDITDYKKAELYNELGIKDASSLIGNSEKLVNIIRRDFESKDFTSDQIEFLFDDGQLKSDLSTALTADNVEKLLISMVEKRVTKLKVNGEGLIQTASTMTESSKERKVENPTLDQVLEYGTNGLRTYYNKDGEVKSMEVKISLQGDWKKLLYSRGVDGKKITEFQDVVNSKGETVRELDYDKTLAKLNALIKNKKWLETNQDIIRLAAPRIPSQGFNSLEFMQIAEFLPQNSGNIMIVPSEIVAKAGSDFDVDKLFSIFPNIDIYDGVPELVKYTDINTDTKYYEAIIEEKIIELNNLKSDTKETLDELFQEVIETGELIVIGQKLYPLYKEQAIVSKNKDELSKKRAVEIQGEITALLEEQASYYEDAADVYDESLKNEELREEQKVAWDAINKIQNKRKAIQKEIDNAQRQISGSTVKGLENNILDLIVERLKMQDVFPELIKPNSTSLVKGIADNLESVATDYNKNERVNAAVTKNKKGATEISSTQILDPMFNINKQVENSVGKDTLGIAAVGSSQYAIYSAMGMYLNATNGVSQERYEKLKILSEAGKLKPAEQKEFDNHIDYTIQLPHNTKINVVKDKNGKVVSSNVVIDLAGLTTSSGENIADLLGQLINGYVDVAKDAWVFNIQGNKEVAPTLIFLITAGVDFKQAVMLASSKYVRQYISTKIKLASAFHGLSKFNVNDDSTHDLIRRYNDKDAINEVLSNNKQGSKNPGMFVPFNRINDVYADSRSFDTPLDMDVIEKLVLNPLSVRTEAEELHELNALFQFVAYEQTAKQLTNLSQATKFDTSKATTLAEIRNNKKLFDNLSSNAALPTEIQDMILSSSPVGMFDTNQLQLDLWSGFIALKNHEQISAKSLEHYNYQSDLLQPGRKPSDNEKDFAEEFVSYIYQNESTRIENDTYAGVSIKADETEEFTDIKDGVFTYNPFHINAYSAIEYTGNVYGLGNTNSAIKFYVEYDLIDKTLDMNSKGVTDSISYALAEDAVVGSIKDEEYPELLREAYIHAESAIRSGNANLLFNGPFSFAKRLGKIKAKYPYLSKEFTFVKDLTADKIEKGALMGKENLYLSNYKETGYKDIYSENLDILREYIVPELSQFFKMVDRFAALQSGVKSFGKYAITSAIDQSHIDRYVAPVKDGIINNLDKLSSSEKSDFVILDDFAKQFFKLDGRAYDFKTFLINKSRGTLFESDEYFETSIGEIGSKELTLAVYPYAIVDKIHKDLAFMSDKVIISNLDSYPNTRYKNPIGEYKGYISQYYGTAVDQQFTADDSIWIVGDDSTKWQYGDENKKVAFDTKLSKLFKSDYVGTIMKAIDNGVVTFNIGSNRGIEKTARDFMKSVTKDTAGNAVRFTEHKIVKPDGIYYQYSTESEVIVDGLYSTLPTPIKVDTKHPILTLKNTEVKIVVGNNSYDNLYNFIAAKKASFASVNVQAQTKKAVADMGPNPTTNDWISLINNIVLEDNSDKYNEELEIRRALFRVSDKNATFKTNLEATGKALIVVGEGYKTFDRNFGQALMELRKHYNGPVTKNVDNTGEDPFACSF